MDLQAFYFQAAEAAATVPVQGDDDVAPPKLPSSRAALLLKFDVQQAVGLGAGDAAAHGKILSLGGAAAAGMADSDARAREGGCLARDLICPECGKAFQSHKAMYGHLRAHPERGYKGASRPVTPAAAASAAAGDARPRKAPPRKEAPELPAIKWPVTAKRSRTPTVATSLVSTDPAAVLLPEPPAPLLLEPPRGVEPVPLQLEPPRGVERAVLLLESPRGEEEEAAMTLMELYQRMRSGAPTEPEDQLPMHVDNAVAGHQMPRADQLELPADHVARASHYAPVEHIFGIILGPQREEAEQSKATAAASKGKKPMEPEPVSSDALVMFRDKLLSPGASKRPKKRPLQDADQTQPPAAADAAKEAMPPPLRRIPSPASDRRFVCPMDKCAKTFPTYQALGGHMANHNRTNRCTAAQNMDGYAAAHAVKNIMLHHQLHQDALLGEDVLPPVAKAPKTHSCSRCDLIFPTGQALGGHMRKHWLEEKMRAAPSTALAVPILDAVAPDAAPVGLANALALALAVQAAAAPANALVVPMAAAAPPNGEPRDFEFDLNEMPME